MGPWIGLAILGGLILFSVYFLGWGGRRRKPGHESRRDHGSYVPHRDGLGGHED